MIDPRTNQANLICRERRSTERHTDSELGDTTDLVNDRAAVSIERLNHEFSVLEADAGSGLRVAPKSNPVCT